MKIRLLKGVYAHPVEGCRHVGDVWDCSLSQAEGLIAGGYAERVGPPEPDANVEPVIETTEAQPTGQTTESVFGKPKGRGRRG